MSRSATKVERQPKLFFVSTSATTSTLQTASVCYSTSGTPTTCTGRRRRSINIDGVPLADVKPSQLNQEVKSSEGKQNREGRFLLYWITTTSISTSTSYTTTIKISAATCTPATGINWSLCNWYSTKLIMLFLFVLFDWYIFWNPWNISLFLLIWSLFNVSLANIDREFYKGCLSHFCLDINLDRSGRQISYQLIKPEIAWFEPMTPATRIKCSNRSAVILGRCFGQYSTWDPTLLELLIVLFELANGNCPWNNCDGKSKIETKKIYKNT